MTPNPEITMNNPDISMLLLRRYQTAQHPLGRLALNAHVLQQRLRAYWLAVGPDALKRLLDIICSLALILLFAPLMLVIAIAVKLEDGGPVFFSQTRIGRFGREFRMYKIRSMCLDAEQRLKELLEQNRHKEGVTFKIEDDPRITRVGKWLRKFSLDELPQFWNVFIGQMSLVGPRPPVPREVVKYSL